MNQSAFLPFRPILSVAAALIFAASATSAREVVIVNEPEGSVLAGTLAMPEEAPKAAIVMATGSGAQDRDETIFGHKPFKTISDFLSKNGYAVLRLDDRGVGGSTGPTENATTANFSNDIGRAVEWLDSALTEVPVGVLGHSEGGQIACMVAASNPKCRFIVTLAAPAWPGDSLVMAQSRALSMAALGSWPGEIHQRRILDAVKSQLPSFVAKAIVINELANTMGDAAKMPQMQQFMMTQADAVLTPWYREFVRFDPTETIKNVGVAWLALNGDKDMQVPVENLATIKELNPGAKTVRMAGHNHLLQSGAKTGLPNEYEEIQEDISEETLAEILKFLSELEL